MTDRLYYDDAFLKSFSAQVVDIREASRADGVSIWQIALDRSAFYPASGGQPHDTGILTATSRNGATLEVPIESVEEDDQGEVWHFTRKPLLAGTAVQGSIDWPRRLDHIQQHSGQHLLSAVFARELDAQTVSFHLGETASTIDLSTGPSPTIALNVSSASPTRSSPRTVLSPSAAVDRGEAETLLAEGRLRKLPERERKHPPH